MLSEIRLGVYWVDARGGSKPRCQPLCGICVLSRAFCVISLQNGVLDCP